MVSAMIFHISSLLYLYSSILCFFSFNIIFSFLFLFFSFVIEIVPLFFFFFFFNDTATTEIYTLSLHDALPISAEIVVQTRREFDQHILRLEQGMSKRMQYLLLEARHRLQELAAHRGFQRLEEMLRQYRQQLDELTGRLAVALRTRLELVRRRFSIAQTRIAAFDFRARIAGLRLRLEQRSGDLRVRLERFQIGRAHV